MTKEHLWIGTGWQVQKNRQQKKLNCGGQIDRRCNDDGLMESQHSKTRMKVKLWGGDFREHFRNIVLRNWWGGVQKIAGLELIVTGWLEEGRMLAVTFFTLSKIKEVITVGVWKDRWQSRICNIVDVLKRTLELPLFDVIILGRRQSLCPSPSY